MKTKNNGQKAALARYPRATQYFNDFSLAQGYSVCYNERVEPLLRLLEKAKKTLSETESFSPESINCIPHESLMNEIDEAFRQADGGPREQNNS
jgi:hypothetical protein